MKKAYQKPCAKKINFNFEKVIASSQCGSGIVLTHNPGTKCHSMTPDEASPFSAASLAYLDPTKCGYQTNPNG